MFRTIGAEDKTFLFNFIDRFASNTKITRAEKTRFIALLSSIFSDVTHNAQLLTEQNSKLLKVGTALGKENRILRQRNRELINVATMKLSFNGNV